MITDGTCRLHGCTNPRNGRGLLCMKHQKRFDRYGDPAARSTSWRDLRAHRPLVEEGMARYANSKALHAALKLTEDCLNYKPLHGFTFEIQMAERGRWLLDKVTVEDVLQRVVEFYSLLQARPDRYPTVRTERYGLARSVLQLGGMGQWRPTSKLLANFGAHLSHALGPFALAFLQRLTRDESERRALIATSSDINAFDPESTDAHP
jgi:hypothetical protein